MALERPAITKSQSLVLQIFSLLFCVISCAFLTIALKTLPPPVIKKVEPPSWWANHSINPVRVLVYGENLTDARVSSANAALKTSDVQVTQHGTYLFVNVTVSANARPGTYPLMIATPSGKVTFPFTIETALERRTHFQGINADDVIYLIMTDRFANGDTTNDVPTGSPPAANDRKNSRAYHGGDLRGVIDHLSYLKELGITAIWLTPWYDNWNGLQTCDKPWCPSTYYHGYHAIDYYGVEDHFGDLVTLKELIEKAHELGIKVIQDQVANHIGSHHPWTSKPPLEDWFHGTLANHMRDEFQNSTLLSPHANQDQVRNTLDGWFNDDMPDMNQEQPEVSRYEIQNALWWVGITGIDGIRQDTIQYLPRAFIRDLCNALHRQESRMWMVGEVFEQDVAQTSFFIGGHTGWDGIDTRLDSVFDFTLWNTSRLVFTNKLPARALRDVLKYDALYPDPFKITTLVNNHDTPRFMSLDGASLEGAMMHTAFTLTVRGVPQLYAGEEIAMEGGPDPDNRRDFPGGFPGDHRSAFTTQGRTQAEQRMYEWTQKWIALRQRHSAIRRGRLIDLFYDDDSYVFARQDSGETVLIAINRSTSGKKITVAARAVGLVDGTQVNTLVGPTVRDTVANGTVTISVPPGTAVAYEVRSR